MKLKNGLITVLDIGSSKIICLIARANAAGDLKIIAHAVQPSAGVKSGAITDIKAAEEAISSVVSAAEAMCGETIENLTVNISGAKLRSDNLRHDVITQGREIIDKDIMRIKSEVADLFDRKDQEVMHIFPVDYAIDGNHVSNPIGMYAKRLEVNFNIISGSETVINNIVNCIGKCQLNINDYVATPYASGLACLTKDEKELGVIVIDLGAGSSSVAVFAGGKTVFVSVIPVGGQHITNDIAIAFSTSTQNAERVKTLYGNVINISADEREMVEINSDSHDDDHEKHMVSRLELVNIIRPRVDEIFEMIAKSLENSPVNVKSIRRMVITGGGSQLLGIKELSSHYFGKQVRVGYPFIRTGLPEEIRGQSFSAAVGMLEHIAHEYKALPNQSHIVQVNNFESNKFFGKFVKWIKENF